MEGSAKIVFLNSKEEYKFTYPYANCKGIIVGQLCIELGGKVKIECSQTSFTSEIEFKLKV